MKKSIDSLITLKKCFLMSHVNSIFFFDLKLLKSLGSLLQSLVKKQFYCENAVKTEVNVTVTVPTCAQV